MVVSKGGTDVFIANVDSKGELQWVKSIGGKGMDQGRFIIRSGQGPMIVAGIFHDSFELEDTTLTSLGGSDIFLAKYDITGKLLWVKQAGDVNNEEVNALAVDRFNNIYMTGNFRGSINFNKKTLYGILGTDVFITKYDALGNFVWARRAGGFMNDIGQSISSTLDGDVYITGVFKEDARFGRNFLLGNNDQTYDVFVAKMIEEKYCNCKGNVIKGSPGLLDFSVISYERVLNKSSSALIELGYLGNNVPVTGLIGPAALITANWRIVGEYRTYLNENPLRTFYYAPFASIKFGKNTFNDGIDGIKQNPTDTLYNYKESTLAVSFGAIVGYQHIFRRCIVLDLFAGPELRIGKTFDRYYEDPNASDAGLQKKFPGTNEFLKESIALAARFGIRIGYAF